MEQSHNSPSLANLISSWFILVYSFLVRTCKIRIHTVGIQNNVRVFRRMFSPSFSGSLFLAFVASCFYQFALLLHRCFCWSSTQMQIIAVYEIKMYMFVDQTAIQILPSGHSNVNKSQYYTKSQLAVRLDLAFCYNKKFKRF